LYYRPNDANSQNSEVWRQVEEQLQSNIGWNKERYIFSPSIKIDIKNDKVWIQCNNTEADIAQELIEMEIPKQDIVIGFHPPSARKFTDFA
jgi:XisI protein